MKWLFAALVLLPQFCGAADSSLSIVQTGVQAADDAPFVSADYGFSPGDTLYFTFQIAGFSIKNDASNQTRKISLEYEAVPQDANGVPLTPPMSGTIQDELNPEDKNWLPKRRASFVIPTLIAAGDFRVHLTIKDLIAKTEISQDFPFHIGGVRIEHSHAVNVERFRFLRQGNDRKALELPAYSPGDTVYVRFEMVGFATGPQNEYHLSYGVRVLSPDGKPFIDQPNAAQLSAKSFYPAQYLPGAVDITTKPATARGQYVLILTVHDLIAKTPFEIKKVFSIE